MGGNSANAGVCRWLLPQPLPQDHQLALRQVRCWTISQVEELAALVDDPQIDDAKKARAQRDLDLARMATPTLQLLRQEFGQATHRSRL